jgi:hypothetical protein
MFSSIHNTIAAVCGVGGKVRGVWQALLWAGVIPIWLTAVGDAEGSDGAYRPLLRDGVPAAQFQGVWQSRGYGWILELNEHGMVVHQTSAAGCSIDPRTAEFGAQFAYRLMMHLRSN